MSSVSGSSRLGITLEARQRSFGLCARCFYGPTKEDPLQLHHVISVTKGGVDHAQNLVLLCGDCHAEWHRYGINSTSFDDFIREVPDKWQNGKPPVPRNWPVSESLFQQMVKELKTKHQRFEERGIVITCRLNTDYCPIRATSKCRYNRGNGKCDNIPKGMGMKKASGRR